MTQEKKNKFISGFTTALVLGLIVVICLAFGYDPPDPPIPEEGVEVNLGNSDNGLGDNPMPTASEASSAPRPAAATEHVSTQSHQPLFPPLKNPPRPRPTTQLLPPLSLNLPKSPKSTRTPSSMVAAQPIRTNRVAARARPTVRAIRARKVATPTATVTTVLLAKEVQASVSPDVAPVPFPHPLQTPTKKVR